MAGLAVVAILVTSCVGNPGEFTLTVKAGSSLVLSETSADEPLVYGTPSCGDAADNDLDGLTDASDPECDSATDANERLNGVQAYQATTLPLEIDAAGVITVSSAELTSQQTEACVDVGQAGVWCLGVTVVGVGSSQTGSINTTTGEISLPLSFVLEADPLVGFSGLPSGCQLGPFSGTFRASSYSTSTGAAQLVANDVPVPAVTACGTNYNNLFNGFFALPGMADATFNTTILDGAGNPVTFQN